MSSQAIVAGVGMISFTRSGAGEGYAAMGTRAARAALADARIDYALVQQAYAGHVFADSTAGQAAVYGVGLTGIPVINVGNGCATGSTALFLARQAVESGAIDCALVLGFDRMRPGVPGDAHEGRPGRLARIERSMAEIQGLDETVPRAAQCFGGAARTYMREYDVRADTFARIAVKARAHAAHNPHAVFRAPLTLDEVLGSPVVFEPLTQLQCCPATCGAAAAVICSPAFAAKRGLDARVAIAGQAMSTDRNSSFDEGDMRKLAGYDVTRQAASQACERAGIDPADLDVVELHDCFTSNELITYEALGLTPEGTAERFVLDGDHTYGGQVVVNPSGGLLAQGHAPGATGLAQCAELVWQLRGAAGARQVEGARLALQHNQGLGGACVITLYERRT